MKVKVSVWLAIMVITGVAYSCVAEETVPAETGMAADAPPADAAAIRAEMHRTMAALIEAQAAEEPDQEQIAELSEKLGTLRTELWQTGPRAVPGEPRPGWQCPWAPDARGWPCPRWGHGPGYGFGAGHRRGRGPQRGYGPGAGWGYGPGPGYGPGVGARPGFGPRW